MSNNYYYYYGKYLRPFVRKDPQKTYTVTVLSLLTVIVFGTFAIAPTVKVIIKSFDELDTLKKLSTSLSLKIEQIQKARFVYAEALPFKDALEEQIYPFEGWGKVVAEIELWAYREGASVVAIIPKKVLNNEGFLEAELNGDYLDVASFLRNFTAEHPNCRLEKLSLEKETDEFNSESGQVKAVVLFRVLFLESKT